MDTAYAYCLDLVRTRDRDRFIAGLFAPAEFRPHLFALYAFNQEIIRIRDMVSDALPGEIRLQWWHDAIGGTEHGDVRANPIAAALLDTIERFGLSRTAFHDLIEARSFDFYDDPMPSVTDLECYAGETSSALIALGAHILGGECNPSVVEVAAHAGMARAYTDILVAFPYHARRHQLYLPGDVLERHGVESAEVFAGKTTPGIAAALAELRGEARRHLDKTRALIGCVPPQIAPVFLEVSLVERYLKRMEKSGYDPFGTRLVLSPLARQWTLWKAARAATRCGC
ncbi:MAG: phytoene/squalene synthase family protein [Hyphomicrobiales bacterium]|nr:MAG: phytoene/squalene synthase family protein [Hyphomicrobiales bacterium]